jgi:hypothetical protein
MAVVALNCPENSVIAFAFMETALDQCPVLHSGYLFHPEAAPGWCNPPVIRRIQFARLLQR